MATVFKIEEPKPRHDPTNPFIEVEDHSREYWIRLYSKLPNGQDWKGFTTLSQTPFILPVGYLLRRAKRTLLKEFKLMCEVTTVGYWYPRGAEVMENWPDKDGLYPLAIVGPDRHLKAVDGRLHGNFAGGGFKCVIEGVQMISMGILSVGLPDHILMLPCSVLPIELTERSGAAAQEEERKWASLRHSASSLSDFCQRWSSRRRY
jgi:hypothetical protein